MQNQQTIDAQALDLMLRAGSRWVLWLLIFLSIAAAAVVLERLWFFLRERRPRRQIAEMLEALRASGAGAALKALGEVRSLDAAVARACLEHVAQGPAAMEEHVAGVVESQRIRYERGLAFLGTLGSNAALGTQAVMAGIAEALVATAVGLLVALPAVATYNVLMRHVETALASAGTLGHRILAHVKAERPAESGAKEGK